MTVTWTKARKTYCWTASTANVFEKFYITRAKPVSVPRWQRKGWEFEYILHARGTDGHAHRVGNRYLTLEAAKQAAEATL